MRIVSSDASLRCAGVAFYGFLSLFPAIAAAVLVFGQFLDGDAIDQILAEVSAIVPDGPEKLLRGRLEALSRQSEEGLGFGLALSLGFALWSGSRGVNALIYALTRAYYEEQERSFVKSVSLSFALTVGSFVMLVIALMALTVIPILALLLPSSVVIESVVLWLRWPVLAIFIFGALMILYRTAPNRRPAKWRWILPGSVVTSLLWLVASFGFSFYVENFGSYDATFGSLAAVVVLLLWMYYSAMIVVFGACINSELELATFRDTTMGATRPVGDRGAYVANHMTEAPPRR